MQTLGERLEEARKRKGISIREAAEATKIRGDYLQKFEANTFDLDLPPLYVRGFVRNYARYLELDAARFLADYDTHMAGEGRSPRRETRENYGRVEFGGSENETAPASSQSPGGLDPLTLKYLLLGAAAVALTIIVLILVNLFTGTPAPRATPPNQSSAETATAAPATLAADTGTVAQQLTLTATDATRIKIVQDSDKTTIYEGTLARGESRTFRKTGKLLITVEDRTKLRLEVNGRVFDIPSFPRLATAEDVTAGRARVAGEVIPTGGNYGRFALD